MVNAQDSALDQFNSSSWVAAQTTRLATLPGSNAAPLGAGRGRGIQVGHFLGVLRVESGLPGGG